MSINTLQVYETRGRQFPTLEKALEYREGLVEEFFRNTPGFQSIPLSERIGFVVHILDNRSTLADLLDFSVPKE